MEEMYCMHFAREKTSLFIANFWIKHKINGLGREGGYLIELKYLINAINILNQFETDLD